MNILAPIEESVVIGLTVGILTWFFVIKLVSFVLKRKVYDSTRKDDPTIEHVVDSADSLTLSYCVRLFFVFIATFTAFTLSFLFLELKIPLLTCMIGAIIGTYGLLSGTVYCLGAEFIESQK